MTITSFATKPKGQVIGSSGVSVLAIPGVSTPVVTSALTLDQQAAVAQMINQALVGAQATALAAAEAVDTPISADADIWAATFGKVVGSGNLATAVAAVALTDAATVALNWISGINFTLALTTSRILGNPTNGIVGTWRTLLVTQPVAGAAVLTFGNQYVFPGGVIPIIAAGASQNTRLSVFCRTAVIFELYMMGANI
jgi:hypothetical protein